jgi:hypothetical protein
MSAPEHPEFPAPQPDESGRPPRPPKITARGLEDSRPEDESIIDEIARRLATKSPNAYVKRGDDFVAYFPDDPNGFMVRLVVLGPAKNQYRVYYDGSWEDFSSRKAAVLQFGFGLSNGCRLREYSRYGKTYRWVVELWDERLKFWKPDWDYVQWAAAIPQFWHRPVVRYLQNHLIDLEGPGLSCAA